MKHPIKITKTYLFKLSIPIFFSNLAIPLVGIVDTALMGHLGNAKFLAATSIAATVLSLVLWSFGFLRMGTTGLVAQSIGKGDYREVVLTTIRNLSFAIIIGFIILFLKTPLFFTIEYFFQTTVETQQLIKEYISIRILSAPAELILYVLIGLFLGLQKTTISSLIVTFFSIINIILSYYFVIELNMEISGVALGTVIAAYTTVLISLIFTHFYIKNQFSIIPRFKKILVKKKFFLLFKSNSDIFIRTLLLTFAFLWFIYLSSKMGEDYLAMNAILLQFIAIASFILDSYAFSTEGVIGFAIGRNSSKSFLMAANNSFQLSFYSGAIISLIFLLFFKEIINILTNIDYIKFISYEYAIWACTIPIIACFSYQFDGIFIGASQTKEMRNAMVISVLIFVIISLYLSKIFGNHGLWFSIMSFMALRSFTLRFYFSNIMRKFS